MSGEREMTLKEWVELLPEFHYAHKEYKRLVASVEATPQPQASPQASAEDVALVALWCQGIEEIEAAFDRIRASLGVGK